MITFEEKDILREICNNIKVVRSALKQIKSKTSRADMIELLKEVQKLGNAVLLLSDREQ